MSAKNTKIKINIPKYDVEGQMNFLVHLCEVYHFDVRTLITLIFADWINLFQVASLNNSGNSEKAFHSFLSTCENTANSLKGMRKAMNESKGCEDKNEKR